MKKVKEIANFIIIFFIYLFLNVILAGMFSNDLNSSSIFLSTISRITIYLISLTPEFDSFKLKNFAKC